VTRSASFAPVVVMASLLVTSMAHAQGTSIEKCTGNFEEAQLKEKRGKLVEAEQLYAACADAKCPGMIRSDCSARRDEMIRRIPTITVVVRDAAGNDLTAYVEIDGKPVTDRAHAQPIDPGEHTINYRPEGKKPATQKITVVEGEKARVITITARDGEDASSASPSPSSPAPPKEEAQGSGHLIAPVILGSIGVLAIAAGIGLQVAAWNEESKADEQDQRSTGTDVTEPNRNELLQSSKSHRDAAKNDQLLAFVSAGTGLVFIAGGVVLYFVTRPSPKKASFFTPLLAPGFAGASYGLRF
jgi:hypothetical protein